MPYSSPMHSLPSPEGERVRPGGRLKIFFGAAPGVGMTHAMLDAGRTARAAGADVVIGCVETRGRADLSSLLQGLPWLGEREAGSAEFDVDLALARRPARLLVDELAHTNDRR